MPRRVDARDVLDADAITGRTFAGLVVGTYRRSGPNAWDDYELVEQDGAPVTVLQGTPIQLEAEGARFRMRRKGEVIVVAWVPEPGEIAHGDDARRHFLESCVRRDDPTPDGSLGHWLHGELSRKPEAKD